MCKPNDFSFSVFLPFHNGVPLTGWLFCCELVESNAKIGYYLKVKLTVIFIGGIAEVTPTHGLLIMYIYDIHPSMGNRPFLTESRFTVHDACLCPATDTLIVLRKLVRSDVYNLHWCVTLLNSIQNCCITIFPTAYWAINTSMAPKPIRVYICINCHVLIDIEMIMLRSWCSIILLLHNREDSKPEIMTHEHGIFVFVGEWYVTYYI